MPRNPAPEHGPAWRHSRDWYDEYYRRRDILRERYPFASARDLHYRSLPTPVADEPLKPEPPPEPKALTTAQRIWPNLK
jgi:hypothetical protein